jgi:hypothetical protein
MRLNLFRSLSAAVVALVSAGTSVHAATVAWVAEGAGPFSWHVGSNWSTGAVPGPADDVIIAVGTNPLITITQNVSIQSLTLNESLSVNAGTLSVSGSASITATLTLSGGTLSGGIWDTSSGQIAITPSSGNRLLNVALLNDLSLDQNSARVKVEGTTSFPSLLLSGPNAGVGFGPGYTLSGNVIATGSGSKTIEMNGTSGTLTVGATGSIVTAPGFTGTLTVGPGAFFGGAMTLVNHRA